MNERIEGYQDLARVLQRTVRTPNRASVTVPPEAGQVPPETILLPTMLVPCFGLSMDNAVTLLETLDLLQRATGGFRVVILTDLDLTREAMPYGWVIEHHLDEVSWHEIGAVGDWALSVVARGRNTAEWYGVDHVLAPNASEPGFGLTAQLASILPARLRPVIVGLRSVTPQADLHRNIGWRGWLEELTVNQVHEVHVTAGSDFKLRLLRGRSEACLGLVVEDLKGIEQIPIWREALAERWSVFALEVTESSSTIGGRLGIAAIFDLFAPDGLRIMGGRESFLNADVDYLVTNINDENPGLVDLHDFGRVSHDDHSFDSLKILREHVLVRAANASLLAY